MLLRVQRQSGREELSPQEILALLQPKVAVVEHWLVVEVEGGDKKDIAALEDAGLEVLSCGGYEDEDEVVETKTPSSGKGVPFEM